MFAFNFFKPTVWHLGVTIIVFLVAWIAIAVEMRRHYVDLFRGNLRELAVDKDQGMVEFDLVGLQTLLGALNSDKDAEVLSALDIFETYNRTKLLPALILYHPSKDVVLRAFDAFVKAGRTDFLNVARRLLDVEDEAVRATALRNIAIIEKDPALFESYVDDPSPLMSATAIVGMLGRGFGRKEELVNRLSTFATVEEPERRIALLKAIQTQPNPVFNEIVLSMTDAPVKNVRVQIAITMGSLADPCFIPLLIEMLSDADLRLEARKALVKIGHPALDAVAAALENHDIAHKVRRHLPRTISKFEPNIASQMLLSHVFNERDDIITFKMLRGLGRIVEDNPDLPIDRERITFALDKAVRLTLNRMDCEVQLSAFHLSDPDWKTPTSTTLVSLLQQKEKRGLEVIFRLLSVLDPMEDFRLLFDSLDRGSNARAGSTEVLEGSIPAQFRGVVLALLSKGTVASRRQQAFEQYGMQLKSRSYEEWILALLKDDNVAVRALSAHHASEIGMTQLLPILRQILKEKKKTNLTGLDVEAVSEAIAYLTELGEES